MSLEYDCVQGSILGPKLFSLYIKNVCNHVNGNFITSYADDSYVMVLGESVGELQENLKNCLREHLLFLKEQGMVTNLSKTEAVIFNTNKHHQIEDFTLAIDGETFKTNNQMKILGVTFDKKMTWTPHVDSVVKKS